MYLSDTYCTAAIFILPGVERLHLCWEVSNEDRYLVSIVRENELLVLTL